ncbi:MAG: hypothetical protein CW338_06135 [Clostridiales bacterium]|nr:hypothetical protein [Clostridiales bacterium]
MEKFWETVTTFLDTRLGKILLAFVFLLIGILLIRLGRKLIRRAFRRYEQRHPEKKATVCKESSDGESVTAPSGYRTAQSLILSVFNCTMYFVIIMYVFDAVGIDTSGVLTVAGIGGIALSLGSQTLVKDIISGVFLWIDGYVKVGDIINVSDTTGTVEKVSLRTTVLRCANGNLLIVPNGDIRTITNMTRDYRCALVDITVAHGQDYSKAIRVLEEAMTTLDKESELIDEAPRVAGIIASDGRAATIRIESRCAVADCWSLERKIRLAALEALAREGLKP